MSNSPLVLDADDVANAPAPFDVAAVRAQFPSLISGIAHFDGPGGTQTPAVVGEAIARTLTGPLSNRGTTVASEQNAEDAVLAFRDAMADLLGTAPAGIVYGRSATQITYDFSRHLAKTWTPGDEVVVTQLDHDANVRPWIQAADANDVTVRWLRLDPATAELRLDELDEVIGERTRLVAVTAASNLLGTKPPVDQIARRAHEVGALVYVDGVHYAAHAAVDIAAAGRRLLRLLPLQVPRTALRGAGRGSGVARVAEAGQAAALDERRSGSVRVRHAPLRDHGRRDRRGRLHRRPRPLRWLSARTTGRSTPPDRRARAPVATPHRGRPDGVPRSDHVHSRATDRTPTLFLTFRDKDPDDACRFLAARDILAPAGTFYAYEPFRALDLEGDAGLRIGLAPYNNDAEVDRLLSAFAEFMTT